ncbi:hypothetical protein GYMLUDRAFT_248205 [Collybiopsis luxurians FD-317 M1]|uniref:Peptidase A1 domain-containing protein n=1 Tax=Collybiopsis luxurians FD-317 M1 TaxID=944289 RepID=A0A0D0CD70_9AGAR|nr:hypothetical protein GYMLUDRAFT_248205 [Collybiopsis luxurians FD-317 M1]
MSSKSKCSTSAFSTSSEQSGIFEIKYTSINHSPPSPTSTSATSSSGPTLKVLLPQMNWFFLPSSSSELYLGGTTFNLDSGKVEYHDVNSSIAFWQITGASIASGGTSAISGFNTIIDSATTFMYRSPSAIQQFYKFVRGAQVFNSIEEFYRSP